MSPTSDDDPHAGVYYHPKAQAQYFKLPEESQDRLSDFLERKRQMLEVSGGGNHEGLAAEWEPGHFVFWDINLQPQYRKRSRRKVGESSPPLAHALGSYYWIEVLEIR